MKALRLLILEDNPDDATLVIRELERAGYRLTLRVLEDPEPLRAALMDDPPELILSDFRMPRMDALEALAILQQSGRDIPFIVCSGSIGEETAVDVLTRGAADFVRKENLARLVPAVERELREVGVRNERAEAERQLREALRVRDDFLAIAAHELRTPLTTLQLQLSVLLRDVRQHSEPRAVEERLAVAKRGADRLEALINRTLDITRLEAGMVRPARHAGVDLGELVRRAIDDLRPVLEQSGSALDLTEREAVQGVWDAAELETVILNLLSNAIKYSDRKPIHVRVEREANRARLIVADEGIGIDPSAHARIFQRFERAVPSRHYGGFGVGLWHARRLVELHGGTISVASTPGQGATFTVELPIEPER